MCRLKNGAFESIRNIPGEPRTHWAESSTTPFSLAHKKWLYALSISNTIPQRTTPYSVATENRVPQDFLL